MKRVLVYPVDKAIFAVLDNIDLLKDIEIVGLVSPRGWGYCGEEVYVNGKKIIITDQFEQIIKNSTDLWIVNSDNKLNFREFILPKLKFSSSKGIKVSIYRELDEDANIMINKEMEEIIVDNVNNNNERCEFDGELQIIDTPIILAIGLFDNFNEFNMQLKLRKELLRRGYKVLQIGNKNESEIFGFEVFPSFIQKYGVKESSKILMFNSYLKKKEKEHKPDVIVLGVPGEIFPYSNKVHTDFGLMNFYVTRAVSPDLTILGLPFEMYNLTDVQNIKKNVKGMLGVTVDYLYVSNKKIDPWETNSKGKLETVTINHDIFEEFNKNKKIDNLFWGFSQDAYCALAKTVVSQLEEYGKVEII